MAAAETALARQKFVTPIDVCLGIGWRTHWVSPGLPDEQAERVTQRRSAPPDLVVIQPR